LKNATYNIVDLEKRAINNCSTMANINKTVGLNIRRMREEEGISQDKLAGLADLHRAYIGQIERGEKNIGLKNLEKIAMALGVELEKLL
jgi:predicted transcriptional regulator